MFEPTCTIVARLPRQAQVSVLAMTRLGCLHLFFDDGSPFAKPGSRPPEPSETRLVHM